MNTEQFQRYSKAGFNRIPVVKKILADLDTPLSAYLKLAKGAYSYLLESVQGGEKWGRYSIIGLPAQEIIKVFGYTIERWQHNKLIETIETTDPLQWIATYQKIFKVAPLEEEEKLPRFTGGFTGYFGYDTIRYVESRLAKNHLPDALKTPDILLMLSEEVLVFDNLGGRLFLIVHTNPDEENALEKAEQRLEELSTQLKKPLQEHHNIIEGSRNKTQEQDFISGFTKQGYEQAVEKSKQYILDGDIMQVVLSQRLSVPISAEPLDIYRVLRCLNPSPYMYYLNLDEFHIVGSSPEILVRLEQNEITVRPIAGTRPRGKTLSEDIVLEVDLLDDPKERAEHLMLIDLGRNDIGRVAKVGTVKLTDQMIIERYSHVMHIVSNVVGELNDGLNNIDVLKVTFPAGTLSGAPKIRAMEIIDELEPVKRGIYGGAIGYLAWNGDMDLAIAIRTAVIKDKTLHIQAGAGIVADSIPEKEWEETMNKARAMIRAVEIAQAGVE